MTLTTPWGDEIDADAPLPEHPRPQLVRDSWVSLNGRWSYAITAFAVADPLRVADPTVPPDAWDGEIVVPFSPETVLSGVSRSLGVQETLWYRRTFDVTGNGGRLLLHFGAVDQSCRVSVNGVEVGSHTGGYLPFTLDITDAVSSRPGGAHDLVVAVRDVTDSSWLARGKQSARRGGIWYTPQSGIWQTVWLERVPVVAVDRLVLTPHLDTGEVEVTVVSTADTRAAQVEVATDAAVVASAAIPVNTPTRLPLPSPVRRWTPEDPHLYDVTVTLGEDRVASYVGMRSFGVGTAPDGTTRLLLNGEPYLHVGLLDQGYWPDGGYTPPSDAALAFDVAFAKRLGYTMLRKHIKVEPLRWYHHCDRLGMLVWQDAVNGGGTYHPLVVTVPAVAPLRLSDRRHRWFGRGDAAGRADFERELVDMVEHLRSVPSLAMWVPFNEGWGQFDSARITAMLRELDPTRTIDAASGWHDQGAGDLRSRHIYFRRVDPPRRRTPRAPALTEYGGYSLPVAGHQWGRRVFGYRRYRDERTLRVAFERLHRTEIEPAVARGLAAVVYTQLSDVEDEVNGLVTYDRRVVKLPEDVVRDVNDRLRAAAARGTAHGA